MPTFQNPNFLDLLGVSALARVTDEEIWKHLVTPSVKGLLGAIVSSEPAQALDTVRGFFSGYTVTNLNGHKLADEHGLTTERVRFPYVSSIYRTQNGAVVFMRDGLKFEVMCWYGDVDRGRGEHSSSRPVCVTGALTVPGEPMIALCLTIPTTTLSTTSA